MDACSSGEDLMVKTRKPYTITKQRERWTEDEHKRFLEALKLHGRAWQRIEEHIGTKTAVQIRSHAQKFFSKLEKEALVKGIPVAQAIDIEIPPPRPKRKPNNPYPRKTGSVGAPLTSLVRPKDGCQVISSSSCQKMQVLGLEKDLSPEKSCGDEVRENEEEKGGTVCSQRFTCYQEVSSEIKSTVSSGESVRGLCHFPSVKSSLDKTGSNKPRGGAIEARGNHLLCDAIAANDVQNCGAETEIHGSQKFPMQVPVQILDGTLTTRTSSQVPSSDVSYQEFGFHQLGGIPPHPAPFTGPAMESQSSTSRSDSQHNFPSFYPPFAASFPGNQEDYCSLLNMSSVFSRLIIATLQQNPAAHAAASYAAAFWPTGTTTNMEDSADTAAGHIGGLPNRQINSPASLSAIVTATVAAATAWWAAHGLFPYCAPYPGGFTCSPSPTAMGVSPNIGQPLGTVGNKEREENKTGLSPEQLVQKPDPRFSPEVLAHNSASKSSLFESGDSMGPKIMEGITPTTDDLEKKKIEDETEQNESSKGKNDNSNNNQNKKQVDRSSCGSNSSSDIETDALEKNHDKGTVEEAQELKGQPDPNQETAVGESSSRRNRNLSNSGDSWKEVSDEGRMAFQALFLREKLPQSFSPPRSGKNKENNSSSDKEIGQTALERNGNKTKLDLNSTTMESCSSLVGTDSASNEAARGYKKELGSLSIGLGQGRLKVGRTGFKPYKRCSVEARETRVANGSSQDQEQGPKRLRLEGEAST